MRACRKRDMMMLKTKRKNIPIKMIASSPTESTSNTMTWERVEGEVQAEGEGEVEGEGAGGGI